jgi:peroxiredoxin
MLVQSSMLDLGTQAPAFELPDGAGRRWSLPEFDGASALLVAFICNHCPFVHHVIGEIINIAGEYEGRGLRVVGINSSDLETHPEDAPDKMVEFAAKYQFNFPYLFDESQGTALAYRATCTPDLFLFDADQKLAYRGQLDASRPNNGVPVTGKHLRAALDAVLTGHAVEGDQLPSIGCSIKWKEGLEPDWA